MSKLSYRVYVEAGSSTMVLFHM